MEYKSLKHIAKNMADHRTSKDTQLSLMRRPKNNKLRSIKGATNQKGRQVIIQQLVLERIPSELNSLSVCGSKFQQSTERLKNDVKS